MPTLDTWNILAIVAIISLILFGRGKSSIWGGLTLGIIIGLIIAVVYVFKGDGFLWTILKKAAIIGTLAGLLAELLGRMSEKTKRIK